MKKTKITTKALSLLLTVIMLFTTISVGIVLPEADLTASAAEEVLKDCWTQKDIEDAIKEANNNPSKVIKIQLGQDIDLLNESLASFTAISGNVIFDFNGHNLTMAYYLREAKGSGNNREYQLPSSNKDKQHTGDAGDLFTNGMFIVSAGGTMQIINSKQNTEPTMQVITEYEDYDEGDTLNNEMYHQTSSSLIYSEGTLILGDKDSAYNNFNLYAHSLCRSSYSEKPLRKCKKAACANAYAVTINNSKAVFKMYGGKVQAVAAAEARRDIWADVYCYALNVNNCSTAEIYGGEINVPEFAILYLSNKDDIGNSGIYQATTNACSGGTSRIAAIRNNSSNLYIFDVDCEVYSETDKDSSKNNTQYTSAIWAVAAPYVYGGYFKVQVKEGSDNSSADNKGYIINGSFRWAQSGTIKPSSNVKNSDGTELSSYGAFDVGDGEEKYNDISLSTIFYGNDELAASDEKARNAINMFDYPDFPAYLKAYTGTTVDGYYGDTSISTMNSDGSQVGIAAAGKYLRNGYTHTGWKGKLHPGDSYSTDKSNLTNSGVFTNGGSLFLAPTWTANEYPIEYVLGGTDEFPVINENNLKNNFAKYKINDAEGSVPIPVRHGYTFNGWTVTETKKTDSDEINRWPTDDSFGWGTTAGTGGAVSTFGKYGNVTLTAKWTANKYTVNVYTDKANSKYNVTYSAGDITASTPIRTRLSLTHYTFDGFYEVKSVDTANTNWARGTKIYVADVDENGNVIREYTVAEINDQFAGKYGNITDLRASYTPVEYDILYFTDSQDNIPDTPVLSEPDHFTYNVDDAGKELSPYKPSGEKFNGWEVVWTDGNWTVGEIYKAVPDDGVARYGTVHLKANCDPRDYTINIEISGDESFPTNDRSYGYSFKNGATISETPSRPGYDFMGWKVDSAVKVNDDDVVNWPVNEVVGTLSEGSVKFNGGFVGNVTLVPDWEPHGYKITFNGNNADQGNELGVKDYHIGSTADVPDVSRNGYVFKGWKPESTSGTWKETESYFIDATTVLNGFWGDVTLVAQWDQEEYSVSFLLDGGNGDGTELIYRTESSLGLPYDPERTGYEFGGWEIADCDGSWVDYKATVEANGGVVTGSLPAGNYGNITLKAKWNAIKYTIQLKVDNSVVETIEYCITDTITLPVKTASGQDFVTWRLSESKDGWSGGHYDAGKEIGAGKYGNIVLEAVLNAKTYYITFVEEVKGSDELTPVPGLTRRPYYYTKEFELPEVSKNGYTFGGWKVVTEFDEDDEYGGWRTGDIFSVGLGSGKTTVAAKRYYGDITLKAVYTIEENNNYSISFNSDGGSNIADITYNTESDMGLPEPVKTGYVFDGWILLSQDGNWTQGKYSAGEPLEGKYGNASFLASWKPEMYTITWEVDGKVTTESVAYGTKPQYKEGTIKQQDEQYSYTFSGWSPAIEIVTGDAKYTAQYKTTLRSYKVTWKYPTVASGNNVGNYETQTVTYKYGEHPIFNNGQNPTITVSDEGIWSFRGWQIGETDKYLNDDTTVTGEVTYVAVFEKIKNPVKITWIVNAVKYDTYWEYGTENPSYPGSLILPDEGGRSNRITGWQKRVGQSYVDLKEIPPATENAEYYAIITGTVKKYKAVFDLDGGKYSGKTTVEYDINKGLTMLQPVKEGYIFGGWIVTDTDSNKWTVNSIYTENLYKEKWWGDVDFKAHWVAENYTVTVKTDSGTTALSYTIEDDKTFPALEKEGYQLTGWIIENASAGSNWMMGDTVAADKSLKGMYGNITVSPVWTAKSYTIQWISGETVDTVTVRFGDPIFANAPRAKDGYTAEWDKTIPAEMPATDLEFNAVYSAIQYYVKLNTNGGSTVASFYYNIKSENKLPSPERTGADFVGWKVSAGNGSWEIGSIIDGGTAVAGNYGNVTLTAVWSFHVYEITWKTGDTIKVTKWYYGAQPSYDGTPFKASDDNWSYKFTGKWKGEDGKLYDGAAIPTVTGAATYTAEFDKALREYEVKWKVGNYVISQTYSFGQVVKCPYTEANPPALDSTDEYDYIFMGWSPEISTIVTGDVTYEAVFDLYTKIMGLSTDKTSVFIDIDDSVNITAIIHPTTATSKDVEWVSLNQNIATVNDDGKVVGVSAGETLVRVQSKDGKYRAYCFVNVAPVITEYIVVSAAGVSTTRLSGEAIQLYATVMPANASNKIVRWTTSDAAVATVDANGLVVFREKEGTAVITATSDGYATGSITVTTTKDKSAVKDNVNTYVVMFNASTTTYIIAGQTYESINIICKEGDTIEFLLTDPHFVTLNAAQFDRDPDGVYRIKNIDSNYNVYAVERPDTGFEEEPEEPDNGTEKLSFFDKLKAFFRSIVEFFRGLFGG